MSEEWAALYGPKSRSGIGDGRGGELTRAEAVKKLNELTAALRWAVEEHDEPDPDLWIPIIDEEWAKARALVAKAKPNEAQRAEVGK